VTIPVFGSKLLRNHRALEAAEMGDGTDRVVGYRKTADCGGDPCLKPLVVVLELVPCSAARQGTPIFDAQLPTKARATDAVDLV
jgi:hypothetical protein